MRDARATRLRRSWSFPTVPVSTGRESSGPPGMRPLRAGEYVRTGLGGPPGCGPYGTAMDRCIPAVQLFTLHSSLCTCPQPFSSLFIPSQNAVSSLSGPMVRNFRFPGCRVIFPFHMLVEGSIRPISLRGNTPFSEEISASPVRRKPSRAVPLTVLSQRTRICFGHSWTGHWPSSWAGYQGRSTDRYWFY